MGKNCSAAFVVGPFCLEFCANVYAHKMLVVNKLDKIDPAQIDSRSYNPDYSHTLWRLTPTKLV